MASLECAASSEAGERPPVAAEPGAAASLRIVLVGKTGSGRSSSGNTILGRNAFWVDASPRSLTARCERQTGAAGGRSVSVTDTPGFFHTRLTPQEATSEVGRCVSLATPGPHVFLVTLRPGRFTQEERDALGWIKATFGPGVTRFTVVLFTGGDQLKGKRIEDFLKESDELSEFVGSCRGGYHVFDNSDSSRGQEEGTTEPSRQVAELLQKVDKMVAENGGGCYSGEMLQETQRAIKEAQRRILGEGAEETEEEREDQGPELETRKRKEEEEERRREEEAARKTADKLFWTEMVSALGRGAAEGVGILGKDKGKGKTLKKAKVVKEAAAFATSPMSVTSAAKALGGAVREGSKVLYKHRKSLLH